MQNIEGFQPPSSTPEFCFNFSDKLYRCTEKNKRTFKGEQTDTDANTNVESFRL